MEKDPIPQATSPLATWLSYLEHLHSKTIDLGLARVSEVAGQMDIVKPAPFVFTVAGTNGKGTTCRTLETILMAAGYKVGVYSSPHLVRYTERVRIQGAELPEAAHTASFAEIEAARGDISLTYFEYGTLSALWLFKQAQLDVVILEVGLGGRLDATNIVDADVAVVTSIALDHTDWLGPDRESIGREKAGIFRAGKPAVVGEPDMPLTIAEVASEKGALLQRRGVDWRYEVEGETWSFRDTAGALSHLPLPQVPLPNAATAVAALRASGLAVDDAILRAGIRDAMLPGRFQIVSESPRVIFDVAHNLTCGGISHRAYESATEKRALCWRLSVCYMIKILPELWPGGKAWLMTGIVRHWKGRAVPRQNNCLSIWVTANHLIALRRYGMPQWRTLKRKTPLVCGSFHTVAHVMEVIDARRSGGK